MKTVDYDARLHAVYAAGRQMSHDALQAWMDAFARHLPETRPLAWLDVGSGTGRVTPSLASATGAGWTHIARDEVTWLRSPSLTVDFERLKLRSVSAFEHMRKEAIEAGFATIEAALPSLGDGPQYETSTLMVFER